MNAPEQTPPLEIDVQQVQHMRVQELDFLFLDCREQAEYQAARIDGATLIPMSQLEQRVGELESHRDRPIVVHCHHGVRSLHVALWLRRLGYAQVQSMQGGIDAWSRQVDASVPRY